MGNILKLNKSVSQAERGRDLSCNYRNILTSSQSVNIRYHTAAPGQGVCHGVTVYHGIPWEAPLTPTLLPTSEILM